MIFGTDGKEEKMENKEKYLIHKEETITYFFSKKNMFGSSLFLMKNDETKRSFMNLEKELMKEGIKINNICVPNCEHTNIVVDLDDLNPEDYKRVTYGKDDKINLEMPVKLCDAIITARNKTLAVMPADCLVLGIFCTKTKIKSIVHCGLKGLYSNIITNTIDKMKKKGASIQDLRVILFPSIDGNNYELDINILSNFKELFRILNIQEKEIIIQKAKDKVYLNLREIQMKELISNGIKMENIMIFNFDTFSSVEEDGEKSYHSYRRDRKKERNIALII